MTPCVEMQIFTNMGVFLLHNAQHSVKALCGNWWSRKTWMNKMFCSLCKLYGRDILTWRRWNPLGWQMWPHVCCLLWGLETDTWGYLIPVWVHLIRTESHYYLNNNLNIKLHLLTLCPSCEVKLWKIRWGNASDIVPMSGTSCLITTL